MHSAALCSQLYQFVLLPPCVCWPEGPSSIEFDQDPRTGRLHNVKLDGKLSYTDANVEECGGEPSQQQWQFNTPMSGFVYNAATQLCLNVANCETQIIYDGCTTTGGELGFGRGRRTRPRITLCL